MESIPGRGRDEILDIRRQHINPNLSVSYQQPLKIIKGRGQYLYSDEGKRYLDMVNNVCHVGHCHPRVAEAGIRQMQTLNTNTRYLHDGLAEYALRLIATFPDPLEVCFFACTGTEANDLAMRLARAATGGADIICVDHAYHGHSPTLIDISPYKHNSEGGSGAPDHVHTVPSPDVYRGIYRENDPLAGQHYAQHVAEACAQIKQRNRTLGAFFCESLLGCGGQIVLPDAYLKYAYQAVREAGGVCVADEVQVGFGRVGAHMWAFERQGVVPDIVTLGKPIGNGHPMSAVITTRKIADAFMNGMEYFNTFGGNPVSCAIGLAVLAVIEEEQLQQHARHVGEYLLQQLKALQRHYEVIGDVRGVGLFIGIELVVDRVSRQPDAEAADQIVQEMCRRGVLLSTDGPDHNVIKIKPPMVIDRGDVDFFLSEFSDVLSIKND